MLSGEEPSEQQAIENSVITLILNAKGNVMA